MNNNKGKAEAENTILCSSTQLQNYCADILNNYGVPLKDAYIVSQSLVNADLRGVNSHGVTRMGIYVERIKHGLINTEPDIKIIRERGGTLLGDGGNGLGAVVTMKALSFGLERVSKYGSCSIGIRNSNHYGAAAFYIKEAIQHNIMVQMYSNAPPTMAPWGGVDPYLGTNPFSFGIPSKRYHPIIVDMASSVVARGKIILAAKEEQPIPYGWAIDKNGVPTNDAQKALEGSVLPFGGPKGYCIALMIDIMAGVLTLSNFGNHIPDLYREMTKPQNIGAFIQLTGIEFFMPLEIFFDRVDTMISEIKASRTAPGVNEIYLPGEIEAISEKRKSKEGIQLSRTTVDMLIDLGKPFGLDFSHVVIPS